MIRTLTHQQLLDLLAEYPDPNMKIVEQEVLGQRSIEISFDCYWIFAIELADKTLKLMCDLGEILPVGLIACLESHKERNLS